jgi:hypothetical protein
VNPTRLAELNHQRALVREQLAWLEREIAKECAGSTPAGGLNPAGVVPAAIAADIVLPIQSAPPPLQASPDSPEIEAFRPDPISAASDTRRGCLTVVAIITLLTIAVLTAIYFLRYSDRPLLFVAEETGPTHTEEPAAPATPKK